MSKDKLQPVTELQAYLRDIAARPEQHQAASIKRKIPPDSKHQSAIEALRYCELVLAAKTQLEASRHLNAATAHWKDFMLWDDSIKGEKHGIEQADRRIGKTKLSESEKRQVLREYEAAPVTYGTIKSLARKYDVSDDTIGRIVKKKES